MKNAPYSSYLSFSKVCAGVLIALSAVALKAQTKTWDGGAGNELWTSDANWDPDGRPANGSVSLIELGSGNTINYNTNQYIAGFDLTIGSGTTFYSDQNIVSNAPWRPLGVTNSGTVRYQGTASAAWSWSLQSGGSFINSGVFESIGDGGTLFLGSDTSGYTLDNSSGTIRATNGGIVEFGGQQLTNTPKLVGGDLSTDSSSSLVVRRRNLTPSSFASGGIFVFENVTIDNAGSFDVLFEEVGSNTANSTSHTTLQGSTVVTNTGTTNVRVREANDDATKTFTSTLTQAGNVSFDNQGTLNVVNITAEDVSSGALYEVTSGTATFTNSGTINVQDNVTASGGTHSAEFTTINEFTNAGTVSVDGSGNGEAIFSVTGGNDYIQTTGRTQLNDGGILSAGAIQLQGGSIEGDGGILRGATTIGSSATLEPGNSIGSITFEDGLTLEGTYIAELDSTNLADFVSVDGILDLSSGTLQLEALAGGVGLGAGTFTLASYGSLTGTFFSVVNNTDFDYSIDYTAGSGNEIAVTLAPIPEPATFAFMVSGIGLMVVLVRRRRTVK